MRHGILAVLAGLMFATGGLSGAWTGEMTEAEGSHGSAYLQLQQDGDKITFVNDADQKSWDVMNPETLKDHVGHHVKVSAHVYSDKNSIHVMNVKMAKASKSAM